MKKITTVYKLFCDFSAKITKDDINAHAASASFFIIVCFFPMIILLLSLLKYTPVTQTLLLNAITTATPQQLHEILSSLIKEIYSRSTLTFVSISAVTTLWTASKGFLAIANGLDNICMIEQQRNYFFNRLLSSLYTLIFITMIIVMMFIMTFGEMLLHFLKRSAPLLAGILLAVFEKKYLLILLISALIIMLLYTYVPRRKTSFARQFPGAIFSSVGWLLFTYVYSEYTIYSRSFSYMYGSLTTVIFVMLWLYFCMYILFIGAEINVFLENGIIHTNYQESLHHKRNE